MHSMSGMVAGQQSQQQRRQYLQQLQQLQHLQHLQQQQQQHNINKQQQQLHQRQRQLQQQQQLLQQQQAAHELQHQQHMAPSQMYSLAGLGSGAAKVECDGTGGARAGGGGSSGSGGSGIHFNGMLFGTSSGAHPAPSSGGGGGTDGGVRPPSGGSGGGGGDDGGGGGGGASVRRSSGPGSRSGGAEGDDPAGDNKLARRRKLNCETARRSRIRHKLFVQYLNHRTLKLQHDNASAHTIVINNMGNDGQNIVRECHTDLPTEVSLPPWMEPVGREFPPLPPQQLGQPPPTLSTKELLARNRARNRENSKRTRMRKKLQVDGLQERLRMLERENAAIKAAVINSESANSREILRLLGCAYNATPQSVVRELEAGDGVVVSSGGGGDDDGPTNGEYEVTLTKHNGGLGVRFQLHDGLLCVAGFTTGPPGHEKLPAQASGKMYAGDVLMAINGDNCDTEVDSSETLRVVEETIAALSGPIMLRLIATPRYESDSLQTCLARMRTKSAAPRAAPSELASALDADARAERRRLLNRETAKRSRVRQKLFVQFLQARAAKLQRDTGHAREVLTTELGPAKCEAILKQADREKRSDAAAARSSFASATAAYESVGTGEGSSSSMTIDNIQEAVRGDEDDATTLQRERSRARNRESSKRTRQRKKANVDMLQDSLRVLEHESALIKMAVMSLPAAMAAPLLHKIGFKSNLLNAHHLAAYGVQDPSRLATKRRANSEYEVTLNKVGGKLGFVLGQHDGLLNVSAFQEIEATPATATALQVASSSSAVAAAATLNLAAAVSSDNQSGDATAASSVSTPPTSQKQVLRKGPAELSGTMFPGDVLMSVNGENVDTEGNAATTLRDTIERLGAVSSPVVMRLISAPRFEEDTLEACLANMNVKRRERTEDDESDDEEEEGEQDEGGEYLDKRQIDADELTSTTADDGLESELELELEVEVEVEGGGAGAAGEVDSPNANAKRPRIVAQA